MPITDNVSLLVFLAVGLIIPFLVDLVTHKLASGALKQTVTLALSLASGVLGQFITAQSAGTTYDWTVAAYGSAFTFITGVATYYGLNQTKAVGPNSITNKIVPGGLIGSVPELVTAVEAAVLPALPSVTPVLPGTEISAPVAVEAPIEVPTESFAFSPLDSLLVTPVLHTDDPAREGNLSAEEYNRLAEERGKTGGACNAGLATWLEAQAKV